MKKALLISLGLITALSSLFISCVEDDGLTVYTVSVSSDDNGNASIQDNEATSLSVTQGNSITVVATPNNGYEFIGWFLMDKTTSISKEPTYTFVVSDNISLIAKFELKSIDGYKYVDLGLPSGLKWAACNVGATVPEGYGSYFAWGETEEKEDYSWETYKWCNGSEETITKYLAGVTEERGVLELEDDVAHVKWGGGWRMPTISEQKELVNNCSWEWTTLNDINGYKVTGPNGNSIFLPTPASITGTEVIGKGEWGDYWANSITYSNSPHSINFNSQTHWNAASPRFRGHAVRPVHGEYVVNKVSINCDGGGRVKINDVVTTSIVVAHSSKIDIVAVPDEDCNFVGWFNGESETPVSTENRYKIIVNEDFSLTAKFEKKTVVVQVWVTDYTDCKAFILNNNEHSINIKIGETVTLRAVPYKGYIFDCWTTFSGDFISYEATYTFVVKEFTYIKAKFKPFNSNGYDYVDLGLPSGKLWAAYNVGATKPEEYGGYYAWGETEEKENYSWETYKWCNGSYDTLTKYCPIDHKITLDLEDDVSYVKWGGDWRIPTEAEVYELNKSCSWEWTTLNGVNGYKVTGPNGNSIFLPAAGYRYGTDVYGRGYSGALWGNSLDGPDSNDAFGFGFRGSFFPDSGRHGRYLGRSVRPVSK